MTLRQWDEGDEPSIPGVRIVSAGPLRPLRRRQAADRAGASLRVRRPAPSPPGESLRRRPFGVDPVLPPARRRHCAAARPLPAPRRLDRGLDARVLAELSRRAQRDDRLGDPAARDPRRRARVLLLSAPRAQAAGRGVPRAGRRDRRLHRPARSARAGAAEPLVVFAGRHIPEKGVLALPPALARAGRRAARGDPRRRAVEDGGRAAGGRGRAERRRRRAGLRPGGPCSRFDPP